MAMVCVWGGVRGGGKTIDDINEPLPSHPPIFFLSHFLLFAKSAVMCLSIVLKHQHGYSPCLPPTFYTVSAGVGGGKGSKAGIDFHLVRPPPPSLLNSAKKRVFLDLVRVFFGVLMGASYLKAWETFFCWFFLALAPFLLDIIHISRYQMERIFPSNGHYSS